MNSSYSSQRQQQCSVQNLSEKKHIPQGTCSPDIFKLLEQYQIILSFPLYEYLTLPYSIHYFPCIILKENVDGQECIYHIFHQLTKKRLLSAQKQPNNIGCNYMISKRQKPKKDEYYVGKLRGNFRNNQFVIFDCGQNPKKKCVRKRKQLGFIRYEQSIFNKNQNKIQVLIPEIEETAQSSNSHPKYHPIDFVPKEQKQNLLLQQYRKKSQTIIKLREIQEPKTHSQQNSFDQIKYFYNNFVKQEENRININLGRNKKQSGNNQISFKFNSRTKNTYSLQIGYPFNILQGFSIALSLIETKSSS